MSIIEFYPPPDHAARHFFPAGVILLDKYKSGNINEINEAISFWNMNKYFRAEVRLKDWTDEDFNGYSEKCAVAMKEACSFFSSQIKSQSIEALIQEVDQRLLDDFWELCSITNSLHSISDTTMRSLYESHCIPESTLFQNEAFARHFDSTVLSIMKQYPDRFLPIMLNALAAKNDRPREGYTFPSGLDNTAKNDIALAYIASSAPNLNYLEMIEKTSTKSGISFPAKTKGLAKKRYTERMEEMSDYRVSSFQEVVIRLDDTTDIPVSCTHEEKTIQFTYSSKWIKEHSDWPSILNNFIYLFEYADTDTRFNLHSRMSLMSTLEKVIGVKPKQAYEYGVGFSMLQDIALLQMKAYLSILQAEGLRVESAIEWYYNEQITQEFGLPSFSVSLASEESSFLEKCRNTCPEIENILKRFSLYVREGEIDETVLQYAATEKLFQVPSLLAEKYAYGQGDDYAHAEYYLCSDQCMLHYDYENKRSFRSFSDRLQETTVFKNDIADFDIDELLWLVDKNFVEIDDNGAIFLTNRAAVIIDLWQMEYIALAHMSTEDIKLIKELEQDGFIVIGSSLLSRPESDYLSYILNDERFDNALALRNKYSHGSPVVDGSEERDYYLLLIVLILLTIKINDEFCMHKKVDCTPPFV